jgi:hypothetical protein
LEFVEKRINRNCADHLRRVCKKPSRLLAKLFSSSQLDTTACIRVAERPKSKITTCIIYNESADRIINSLCLLLLNELKDLYNAYGRDNVTYTMVYEAVQEPHRLSIKRQKK